ncbi:MAG TPA: hypothetical protein PLD55_13420 [bacterium]|nr:hypothetical protein [bacterium]
MSRSKTTIIAEIAIKFNPKNFRECYIGTTSSEESKLIREHNLSENDLYLYEKTESAEIALELEKKFLDLGMNRFCDNSGNRTNAIFVYRKNPPPQP